MTRSLAGYAADARSLLPHWFAIDPNEVHAPVLHLFPERPASILDIGAGVGRDAAWLMERGHDVLAIEPTDALREAGMERYGDRIDWLNDRLPELAMLKAMRRSFGLVLISAVWAHLSGDERRLAMPNVAAQVASGGRLIVSIRDGWTPDNRPVFDADPEATIALAKAEGLDLIFRTITDSVQAINRSHDVRWHRLVFERPA